MSLSLDEKLIQEKLNAGDASALEMLFHKYYNDLCRYLIIILKDQHVAKNIVQDLFLYIWERHETIEFKESIEGYLYQASRFNALIYLRNENRRSKSREELHLTSNSHASCTSTEIEFEELQGIINEAVSLLPDRCKEIFILSRHRDLSYSEIAAQLNISISTVDNQINIAIKKVKRYIQLQYPKAFIIAFLFNDFPF